MGNCCLRGDNFEGAGEGHRFGTADEATFGSGGAPAGMPIKRDGHDADLPKPQHDSNLDDQDRDRIRAERAAAAEARLKKQGGPKKKKTLNENKPLVGPNSQPTMRWTAS